jgi:hypothetical protein
MSALNMKKAAGFLVAGAIVGATVAILCLTRNKKVAMSSGDRLEDLQATIRDQVAGWIDEMADIVQSESDRGRKPTSLGYERVFEGFDTAKRSLEAGRNHLERRITSSDSVLTTHGLNSPGGNRG